MATKRAKQDHLGDGLDVGMGALVGDSPVEIIRASDGRSVVVQSGTWDGERGTLEALAGIQGAVREIGLQRTALNRAVLHARAAGLSWATIGFSVGTTGEAARQRWGVPSTQQRTKS